MNREQVQVLDRHIARDESVVLHAIQKCRTLRAPSLSVLTDRRSQCGVPDAQHSLSHHQENPESIEKYAKINAYHVEMFTYFLEKLRTTPDGDGSLLDHATLMYGAGMADSNSHSPVNIPIVLAGGGGGTIKGGRHVRLPGGTPLANMHLTVLEKMGISAESLGDGTGELPVLSGV